MIFISGEKAATQTVVTRDTQVDVTSSFAVLLCSSRLAGPTIGQWSIGE